MVAMLAGLLGVGLQLQQSELWAGGCYGGLLMAGLALLAWHLGGRPLRPTLLAALLLVLGFAWAGWRAEWRLAETVPPQSLGKTLTVTGTVTQLPRRSDRGMSFVLAVDEARWEGRLQQVPDRISLYWSLRDGGLTSMAAQPKRVEAGQRWRFDVQLQPPLGMMNPHGFDLELWMFEQNLRAQGKVRGRAELLEERVGHGVERARGAVREALEARVAEPGDAGVLAGLALGDQASIEPDDWDLFRRTGIAHLLAVSGLHITLLGWCGTKLIGLGCRRVPRLLYWQDAATLGSVGGLVVAVAYALFSGWGIPAQRTVLMMAVVTLLRIRARRWPALRICLSAAWVVAVFDPWALLQAGFWLSFAAVALLMLDRPMTGPEGAPPTGRQRWIRACAAGLRTQWRASFGLAPLSVVFFHQASVVSFAANVIAIPWVSFVVTPLALLGVIWPGAWDLGAAAVRLLRWALAPLGAWPHAVMPVAASSGWVACSAAFAALLGLAPLPWRVRLLAWPLALPLVWPATTRPPEGAFELLAADVGQGSAILIRTAHHALLFDAGPQYSPSTDAGERVIAPLLMALGQTSLDRLVLSHRDLDHVGGAAAVLNQVNTRSLWSSLPEDHALNELADGHTRCLAGQQWWWDGVRFDMLHPLPRDHERHRQGYAAPNTVSCVLRIQSVEGHSALLTGDIEAAQEWALLQRAGGALRSDVLVVPHHGSATSSTIEFLRAVRPRWAVVQAGWRNRYGHPAAAVVRRYEEEGIELVSTTQCGAWHWQAGRAQCERDRRRRYWHTALDSGGHSDGLEIARD